MCRAHDWRLYVPKIGGEEQDGWASFDPTNLRDATELKELNVPVQTLDSFELEDVSFIKLDVEGHELDVLHGAIETLERWKPIVLCEAKPDKRDAVVSFFEAHGYEAYQFNGGVLTPAFGGIVADSSNDNFVFRAAQRALT